VRACVCVYRHLSCYHVPVDTSNDGVSKLLLSTGLIGCLDHNGLAPSVSAGEDDYDLTALEDAPVF